MKSPKAAPNIAVIACDVCCPCFDRKVVGLGNSLEAMRLTNELNRKMNDPNISSDYLLELIKRCAQEKYNALQNQSVGWQNELLKKELESRSPSESLDVQLFQKVVYKVLIAYDTTVTLQLINRKIF